MLGCDGVYLITVGLEIYRPSSRASEQGLPKAQLTTKCEITSGCSTQTTKHITLCLFGQLCMPLTTRERHRASSIKRPLPEGCSPLAHALANAQLRAEAHFSQQSAVKEHQMPTCRQGHPVKHFGRLNSTKVQRRAPEQEPQQCALMFQET